MAADDRGPELATITAVFLGLSSLTVFLRCYVRLCLLRTFRMEDYLALGTLLCFIVYSTFVMFSIQHGAGKHLDEVPAHDIPEALKMRWAGELAYVVTSLFLKFTIGIFLLRICSQKWQKVTIWVVLLVCLIFNLFYTFVAAFQCQPVSYYWLKHTDRITGACLNEEVITGSTYAAAAINACADWILGLLPIALVWNLDLGKRSKVSVAGILALGSIASSATIVRIPYVWQLTHDTDILYEFTDLALWSTVENGLGLTASSIATLKPLFRTFFGNPPPPPGSPLSRKRASGSVAFHCRGESEDSRYYEMDDYPQSVR
ncbi:Uu.00g057890.m01.CDS01 [Anthostomella pinea]|uniref:Uu.00g057890.m01.CDS01 n=1 Tax=Anthostomella pinea TaxID=933095 RepID=A0AAI8YM88_9PEZI|nr:Uu.00g057890.m01.CDS01 [Anthostomella pinea]